jgi:uncharacterized protein (DUF2237 family)
VSICTLQKNREEPHSLTQQCRPETGGESSCCEYIFVPPGLRPDWALTIVRPCSTCPGAWQGRWCLCAASSSLPPRSATPRAAITSASSCSRRATPRTRRHSSPRSSELEYHRVDRIRLLTAGRNNIVGIASHKFGTHVLCKAITFKELEVGRPGHYKHPVRCSPSQSLVSALQLAGAHCGCSS